MHHIFGVWCIFTGKGIFYFNSKDNADRADKIMIIIRRKMAHYYFLVSNFKSTEILFDFFKAHLPFHKRICLWWRRI